MSSEPYRLVVSRPAARALAERLPERVAAAIYAFITGPLVENPQRVGKPLVAPLAPARSARRGSYRVLYLMNDEARAVQVTAIRHRSDAYRS